MAGSETVPYASWRNGFLFIANHLALDFLNTRPVQKGEAMELLPDFAALLRWFVTAKLLSSHAAVRLRQKWGKSARARQVVEAARKLRELLRKQILAWEQGGTVSHSTLDELNRLMTKYPMCTRIKASRPGYLMDLWFDTRQPEGLLAPLAHHAAVLFANVDRNRVRRCGNCVLHFFDTSKKGTRQWCSMQLCGNRLKVAAYAARRRMHG
jgi:predicted RNA-binding Zn ribbon-like protein